MEETQRKHTSWHILKCKTGWRVFSSGLRAYGTFSSMDSAYESIIQRFPKKRGLITVHNPNGIVIKEFRYPLKKMC